jgi:fructose-1,6-bisphosphatase/inositol monophosphatase family enzyme
VTDLYNALPSGIELGTINGPILGIIARECVKRAIEAIREVRFTFKRKVKAKKADGGDDIVTTADKAAQAKILKIVQECFPGFGIISEEDGVNNPCAITGINVYVTIDPMDGTSAFGRLQSHGFGPMIAIVLNGRVICASVGDANTGEIFYYRPDSPTVHRLIEFGKAKDLRIDPRRKLDGQYVLLRDGPGEYSPFVQRLVRSRKHDGGYFKGLETANGSIGLSFSRLWKGEVGAKVLRPGKQTPWDTSPILGMNAMLGFAYLRVEGDELVQFFPEPNPETTYWNHEVIVVHQSRVRELQAWARRCRTV